MTLVNNIPNDKKMLVIFRMEPGALGPKGAEYIQQFCDFANPQLQGQARTYLVCFIEPRFDKSLAEIEFQISAKKLSRSKANQYLNLFGENLTHFEDQFEDLLEAIIDQFLGR